MIERRLQQQLDLVAVRLRQTRVWRGLAIVFLTCAAAGGVMLWLYHSREVYFAQAAIVLGIVAGWTVALVLVLSLRKARNYRHIAVLIEQRYPELDCALITAVEQEPDLPNGQYGYLQQQVIHQVLLHGFRHPWKQAVPASRLVTGQIATMVGVFLFAILITALASTRRPVPDAGPDVLVAKITHASTRFEVTVEPGDTQVERNTGLLVLARFTESLPPEVSLVYETNSGDRHRLPMTRSLDDPIFAARIPVVAEPLTYHVAFGSQESEEYGVGVFTFPELKRADALLAFPDYTGMKEKLVQDVRHISAVEGTTLTLSCFLNKPVASAELVDDDGATFKLDGDETDDSLYAASFVLKQSMRLELRLRDEQGRENRYPPKFVINVLPNRPPDLKLARPSRDVQVSPLEELDIQANAWDDFGLQRVGLSLSMPGATQKEVVLGKSLAAKQRIPVEHTVFFEELNAQPDQLLAYYFWAEDKGPDGNLRRVSSDMYFAEVRHFEEIFRQGQQPTGQQQRQQQRGQQSGNARQAEKLAELQKQIINGTWNLIRRETSASVSTKFDGDVALLVESQQSALEQLEQLAQEIQDPQSAEHVQQVRRHMETAAGHLETSKSNAAPDALEPALATEQQAYQALLKLRAREHEVVRSQQRQSGQQQSSQRNSRRAQQQIQQLELNKDENRYEEQRLAQSQQETQAERENRQVLNRLRELARRQGDLNERIKELQSELQAAKDEEEREQIERQLKRLRDEQQEILRDADELKSRMEQPENQQRMSEQREQLEQAREQARRSSEALQEGMLSQAAASGSRAERELNELRDEFRRRLSSRFNDQMREMKREAREIDDRQQELSKELAELDKPDRKARSLRDSEKREDIQEGLQNQQARVGSLLEGIEKVVEKAEQSEPLLAEQLYDTYRKTKQEKLPEALQSAERLLDRGLNEDAKTLERVARQGIQNLRKGIDRAADSVLGDETEALRRAREELDRLSNELDQEIARNDPSGTRRQQSDDQQREQQDGSQTRSNQDRQSQPGQQRGQRQSQSQDDQSQQSGEGGREQSQQNQDNRKGQPQDQQSSGQQQNGQPRSNQQQDGERRGKPGHSQQPRAGQQPQDGQRDGRNRGQQQGRLNQRGSPPRLGDTPPSASNPTNRTPQGGDGNRPYAPLTGDDFVDWSDRLRDVEEMVEDPELRAEAARIRDRAKGIRKDFKRHSKEPNWDLVKMNVLEPLIDLQRHVNQELLRRTAKDSLVPIDREPVPSNYAEQVRLYYERLGRGR